MPEFLIQYQQSVTIDILIVTELILAVEIWTWRFPLWESVLKYINNLEWLQEIKSFLNHMKLRVALDSRMVSVYI